MEGRIVVLLLEGSNLALGVDDIKEPLRLAFDKVRREEDVFFVARCGKDVAFELI